MSLTEQQFLQLVGKADQEKRQEKHREWIQKNLHKVSEKNNECKSCAFEEVLLDEYNAGETWIVESYMALVLIFELEYREKLDTITLNLSDSIKMSNG